MIKYGAVSIAGVNNSGAPKLNQDASSCITLTNTVGELAVNTADKVIYTKSSSGNIIQLANFAVADPSLTFPTGDLGDLSSLNTDSFGQTIGSSFDSLDTPPQHFFTSTTCWN